MRAVGQFALLSCVLAGMAVPVLAAPSENDPPPALLDDAHCLLDVLRTSPGIEDIHTRLSPRGNLEIDFAHDSSSGALNTARYEIVRVRDTNGFSYRDLEPHYIGTSGIMERVYNRWFEECRAVPDST